MRLSKLADRLDVAGRAQQAGHAVTQIRHHPGGLVGLVGSSLRTRNYRLYFIGQCISVSGNWMESLALSFLVLDLTGSGTALGIVNGVRLLPLFIFGPLGGLIADRVNKRRLLYFTQSAQALVAAALAILCATGAISMPLILLLSFLAGCLNIFDTPTRQSFIAELVPHDQLANAVTLNSVALNVARVLGAAIGGSLVAAIGFAAAFSVNSLSYIAVLISLLLMRPGELFPSARVQKAKGQVRAGLSYARRNRAILLPLIMMAITGILANEFPVTLPLMAQDVFHGGPATYGVMSSVMAVGAIVGGLIAAARGGVRRVSTLAIAVLCWGISILAAGLAPNLLTEFIALIFVGYCSITFNSYAKTTLQLTAEPHMRGRVMSLWALAWAGSTVIGAPIVGWIAEVFGARWSLLIGALSTIVLGVAMLPAMRRIDERRAAVADRIPGASEAGE